MLHEFKLAKTGETVAVEVLGPGHLAQVLGLRQDARESHAALF